MSINRTIKIIIKQISNEYKLQCSIINESNKQETIVKIQNQEEFPLKFTQEGNDIDFVTFFADL